MAVEQEKYEERVIVFIDILGFREHINHTIQDDEYFIKLRDALNFIAELKIDNDEEKKRGSQREITVFSDSIVISYSTKFDGSVFWLLLDVVHIQLEMMRRGILMRGGLTVGQLCHNDNIVYGPAMIEAYELESKVAIYPRVVVNKDVFSLAGQKAYKLVEERKIIYPAVEEEVSELIDLCHQDGDGIWYVDFLNQSQEFDREEYYFEALSAIKHVISQEIEKNNSKPSVWMKYEWLKSYYNEVVKTISKDVVGKWDLQFADE